jgi:hypothetical protein
VKAALNEEEFSAEPKPGQPFKPCCQSSLNYNIRIPYFSDDPSKPKGYFYITISDQSPGMYDEVYWDRADHKTKVIRHDKPFTKVAHHAMIIAAPHYLPGAPQTMPDFTDSKQPPIAGQENKKVEYFPLAIEGKLWDKNATTTFSGEAEDKLLSNIRYGLKSDNRQDVRERDATGRIPRSRSQPRIRSIWILSMLAKPPQMNCMWIFFPNRNV